MSKVCSLSESIVFPPLCLSANLFLPPSLSGGARRDTLCSSDGNSLLVLVIVFLVCYNRVNCKKIFFLLFALGVRAPKGILRCKVKKRFFSRQIFAASFF